MLDVRSRNLVQNHMTNSRFCLTQTPQGPHGQEVPDLGIQGRHLFSKSRSKVQLMDSDFHIIIMRVNTVMIGLGLGLRIVLRSALRLGLELGQGIQLGVLLRLVAVRD